MSQPDKTKHEYYASANGFNGFRSYFGKIFNSYFFDKIFVLKGGPGTGKSSLMKKLVAYCRENNLYYEIFRCSSDPASLDGIIVSGGNKRVAVLDGTAPHERDAAIPGAVDELINLGEAWDGRALEKERKYIFELNKAKNSSYHSAYDNLRYSSIFDRNIKAEVSSHCDLPQIKRIADDAAAHLAKGHGTVGIRLISSFSKDGYRTLDTLKSTSDKLYSVNGIYGSEGVFMNVLADKLEERGAPICRIPSPLDESLCEGVYIKSSGSGVFANCDGEIICDTREYCEVDSFLEHKLEELEQSKKFYLSLAENDLKKASEYHFKLENIYTPNMNFEVISGFYDFILEKTEKILAENT